MHNYELAREHVEIEDWLSHWLYDSLTLVLTLEGESWKNDKSQFPFGLDEFEALTNKLVERCGTKIPEVDTLPLLNFLEIAKVDCAMINCQPSRLYPLPFQHAKAVVHGLRIRLATARKRAAGEDNLHPYLDIEIDFTTVTRPETGPVDFSKSEMRLVLELIRAKHGGIEFKRLIPKIARDEERLRDYLKLARRKLEKLDLNVQNQRGVWTLIKMTRK